MISKELLSEVIRMYPQYTEDDYCSGNIQYRMGSNVVHFAINDTGMQQKNIHELAHKCKEWALSKHKYSIMIAYDVDMFRQDSLRFSVRLVTRDGVTKFRVKDIPEHEAIFKICEWIL